MKKLFIKFLYFLLIFFISFPNFVIVCASSEQDIDYTETLESFDNPERGFYIPYSYAFRLNGNVAPTASALRGNLIHLRLGLSAFSKITNGVDDFELTEDMLNTFDHMLKTIKSNGGTAIIRFAYDDFKGIKNLEPSLDMILKHISQLKPVFEANKDVISYVELGFFGPWGEMHSSNICTTENVSRAIDAMLEAVPKEITIGVRQPKYYVAWQNIDRSKLNQNITVEGTNAYRVGLFNDGYLGSNSDLGTFQNRETEILWLENQARHTFYGGEVVKSIQNPPINTVDYISKEGFRTHTTYLNSGWNDTVINAWKKDIYTGEDSLYKGESGYLYIQNHLGYRFVLRESNINDSRVNEKLNLHFSIENVGFANLINNKVVTILLANSNQIYEIKTEIDATKWNSGEVTSVNISLDLPENIELGNWKVYLRISQYGDFTTDDNYQSIRLANSNVWNSDIGANYIGDVNILEKKESIPEDSNAFFVPESHSDSGMLVEKVETEKIEESQNTDLSTSSFMEEVVKREDETTNNINLKNVSINHPTYFLFLVILLLGIIVIFIK